MIFFMILTKNQLYNFPKAIDKFKKCNNEISVYNISIS